MPIKKKVAKQQPNPEDLPQPPSYKPTPVPISLPTGGIPTTSSRDLNYFFHLAASLYKDVPPGAGSLVGDVNGLPQPITDSPLASSLGPAFDGFNQVDMSATLVLMLFRQTLTHIKPIAERFHLGPADRQPLYALTAQPSPRSAAEFNELCIKRRDPIAGVWHNVCTSDIEPRLQLNRAGHFKVASLTMDAVPVWKRVASGRATFETSESGQGNKLRLWWGDRSSLGSIGDAYGLWYETGDEAGTAEAFYVVQQWRGFENSESGVVRVKPALRDPSGQFVDPRSIQEDLATLYLHGNGSKPPQFVCQSPTAQLRLDFVMAGLMTVLTIETRRGVGGLAAVAHALGLQYTPY
ncbi:hypothetical protein B0T19DRAFT_269119 [Cercophora scortea]|uniref:Uncharacterized protein n=1 Tax=Cercophora scortea TaxID=314031 RepID=A0AAE0I6T7_9PEZI|nr:hypothetical protein B0T19DRAFT_269119 [Cercophora scortea]